MRTPRFALFALALVLCTTAVSSSPLEGPVPFAARGFWEGRAEARSDLHVVVETRELSLTIFSGESQIARFRVSVGRDSAHLARRAPLDRLLIAGSHVIEPGNTLWSLSRRYRVDLWALRTLNRTLDARALRPGTRVWIPRADVQLTPTGEFEVTNKTAHPVVCENSAEPSP